MLENATQSFVFSLSVSQIAGDAHGMGKRRVILSGFNSQGQDLTIFPPVVSVMSFSGF